MTPEIKMWKSAHRTIDVVIYNMPDIKLVGWFELMDIWGSRGYDRFRDGGLYFELPGYMFDIIPDLPFVKRYVITVNAL